VEEVHISGVPVIIGKDLGFAEGHGQWWSVSDTDMATAGVAETCLRVVVS
jgi:hypothetical protein